jgi:hypothetical protein
MISMGICAPWALVCALFLFSQTILVFAQEKPPPKPKTIAQKPKKIKKDEPKKQSPPTEKSSFEDESLDFRILRSKSAQKKIDGLNIDKKGSKLEVNELSKENPVQLNLNLQHKGLDGGALLFNSKKLEPTTDGKISAIVPITEKETMARFVYIDALGKYYEEQMKIIVPSYEILSGKKVIKEGNPLILSPGLGYTTLSYNQTGISEFTQGGISLKVSISKRIGESRWDIGGLIYGTLLPIGASLANVDARFLGLNFRAGYQLPWLKAPWRLALYFGGYYTTMLVTNRTFGYQHQIGPQIYPFLARDFGSQHTVSTYLKFAPVMSASFVPSLDNAEIAAGLSYSYKLKNKSSISFSLDYASLKIFFENKTVTSNTLTFGAGYSLRIGGEPRVEANIKVAEKSEKESPPLEDPLAPEKLTPNKTEVAEKSKVDSEKVTVQKSDSKQTVSRSKKKPRKVRENSSPSF